MRHQSPAIGTLLSPKKGPSAHSSCQIYIKDVKSSNGTFINGERLSAEGVESDPFELKTDDIVVRDTLSPPASACPSATRNSVSTSLAKTIRPSYTTK